MPVLTSQNANYANVRIYLAYKKNSDTVLIIKNKHCNYVAEC